MQSQALTTFTNLLRSSDLARQIRRNSVTEAACQIIGRGCILKLRQINMNLEVTGDDILVDCGANVGQITSLFARTGATVHSFEPNPRCVQTLRKRFRLVPNVTIHHAGVMDSACKLTLRVPYQNDTTSWETSVAGTFLRNATPIDGRFDEYEVQCVDLASWVLSQPRRIRLMKLDIEGAEVAVISHLLDTRAFDRIDFLVCETHEMMNAELSASTAALRLRVQREGLNTRVRFDWP